VSSALHALVQLIAALPRVEDPFLGLWFFAFGVLAYLLLLVNQVLS
jgi:hypothetical protein